MDQEAEFRNINRLKTLVAQCDESHSSVLSILSDLRNHVKSSDMLEALKHQREQMLEKVVAWAENSVNMETSNRLSLIEMICFMKAREGKLKAVIKVCDPLFKDLPGYHAARHTMESIAREISQQVAALFRKWCQTWSTVSLDTRKPCITIDPKTQIPLVTFEPRLVTLSRECRTLRCLGFTLPEDVVSKESDLKKYGHIARQLEGIVNFYCTIGDQILLSQRPILIDAARSFTSLLESRNTMTWDRDPNQLEAWLGELGDFARKFGEENRRLRAYHRSVLKLVVKLFDLPIKKWRPIINEIATILASVDASHDNTLTWKKHWDYQLYKILEYHFNMAVVQCDLWLGFHQNPFGLHDTSPGPLRVDLIFKAGQVSFRPSLEEIQSKIYSRINNFLTIFTKFKGFLATLNPELVEASSSSSSSFPRNNIFSAIYLRNLTNLPLLYQEADLTMAELIDIGQQFQEWTSLYHIIQQHSQDMSSLPESLQLLSLEDYRNNLTLIKSKGQEFNKKFIEDELTCSVGNITINLTPIKVSIDWIYGEADRLLISSLRRETESLSKQLNGHLNDLLNKLTSPPEKISQLLELEEFWSKSSIKVLATINEMNSEFNSRYTFLCKWSAKNVPDVTEISDKVERFQSLMDSRDSIVDSFKQLLKSKLESRSNETKKQVESLIHQWSLVKAKGYPDQQVLEDLKNQFQSFGQDLNEFVQGCQYFNLPGPGNVESFEQTRKEVADLSDKLSLLRKFEEGLEIYHDMEWIIARNKLPLIEGYIDSWRDENKNCGEAMLAKISEWKAFIQTLKSCRGESFAKVHWDEFMSLIGLEQPSIPVESLKFSHLIQNREQITAAREAIRDLNSRAIGEQSVRETFNELEAFAVNAKFDLYLYKAMSGEVRLIKNWRNILNQISESILTLNSLKGSAYYGNHFAEAGIQWESRLAALNQIINGLNSVQRKWTYLEPIYTRNQGPDIFNDSSFTQASRDFLTIMKSIEADSHLVRILRTNGLAERLNSIDGTLNLCQRKLNLFMEESRNRFPRFYFLADDDLLQVLAGKASLTEAGLLKKLFNNTITKIHAQNGASIMVESPEGEQIKLRSPVPANFNGGSVEIENWLKNVESEVRRSLKTDLFDCLSKKWNEDAVWTAPSQIVSLVQWIRFTAETEECIRGSRLKSLRDEMARQLSSLIAEDSKAQRDPVIKIKVRSMVLDVIHFIAVVEELISGNVSDIDDWRWRKQLRYYADMDRQTVKVSMGLASVNYSFDYIGCYGSAKLVHTPLTDKCYLVCMQALAMGLGGNPYGPAGTGKTETVKALGHQLGRQVLVFNCDEAIDVKAMTRILIGLIKCGSWGCFDEFNRLQVEVLSSLSSLIQAIQMGFKSSTDKIKLNGIAGEITINRNSGIFVTLNPAGKQYKGRNELPDNLKALFLPVAMTVPDSALIARVLLLSEGFSLNRSAQLGQKITAWFDLAKDSMSYQKHYDWGLRAIKSCLASSGRMLRSNPGQDELTAVIQALQRQIKSKLVEEDQQRFNDLIVDVIGNNFAGADETSASQLQLDALKAIIQEMGLIVDSNQIGHILVLDEQIRSRLGVVILGDTGVGKSTVWRVLMAYKKKISSVNIVPTIINPKAMSRLQLLGYIDEETREWHDGVLTKVARSIARDESQDTFWIIFDGEIDPEWVEALNSVLDDNRVLTLPSGERIDFDPAKVSLLFETTSLQYSSPATISRVGIISLNFPMIMTMIQATLNRLNGPPLQLDQVTRAIPMDDEKSALSRARTSLSLLKYASERSQDPAEILTYLEKGPQSLVEPRAQGSLVITSSISSRAQFLTVLNELGQHVLLVGAHGTGKNVLAREVILKQSSCSVVINCVPQSLPDKLIQEIKAACHIMTSSSTGSSNSKVLKPRDGVSLVIYIRNMELLEPDQWGCVSMVAFLTTLISHHGFHDSASDDWMVLENFQFIGTCSDLKLLDKRFISVVNIVQVDLPPDDELQSIIKLSGRQESAQWADSFADGFVRLVQGLRGHLEDCPVLSRAMFAMRKICCYETVTNEICWREAYRSLASYIPLESLSNLERSLNGIFGPKDHSKPYSYSTTFGSKLIPCSSDEFQSFTEKAFTGWINQCEIVLGKIALIPEVLELFAEVNSFLSDHSPGIKGLVLLGSSGSGRKLACKVMANHFGYDSIWNPRFSSDKQVSSDLKSILNSDDGENYLRKILLLIDQAHFELLPFLQEKISSLLLEYQGSLIVRVVLIMSSSQPLASSVDHIWSRSCNIYRLKPWSDDSLKALPKILSDDLDENSDNKICESFVLIYKLFPQFAGDCRRYLSFVETFTLVRSEKFRQLQDHQDRLEKGVGKLEQAGSEVEKLKNEATSQQKILAAKRSEADTALNLITMSMHDSEDQKVELEEIKSRTERESVRLRARKSEIEVELKSIEPILQAAKAAVGGIKSEALSEIRSLRAPPEVIRDILEGVLRLMGVSDTSWVSMKSFLSRRGIKDEIINFDARRISPEMRSKVEALLAAKPESFDEKQAKRASVAAAPLANWVKANLSYSKVLHKIKPLEDEQAKLESNLRSAQNRMKSLASQLNGVEAEVGSLRNKLNEVTLEAAQIEVGLNKTNEVLARSQELIAELSSEYQRWRQQLGEINQSFGSLSAKCLIVAGYINFIGREVSSSKRSQLFDSFCTIVGIERFSISGFMEVSSDEEIFYLISGRILTTLLVDPSRKSLGLIEKAETIDLTKPDWSRLLELSLRFGKTAIIDGLSRQVNLSLMMVMKREIFGSEGSRCYIYLGDKRVDFNSNFKMYLFTAESFSPLLSSSLVNVVNMSPSNDTTSANLLSLTILIRRPQLEEKKAELDRNKRLLEAKLKSLEDQLLIKLNSASGNILNDRELIAGLKEIKTSAREIQASLSESGRIANDINRERQQYQSLASLGSNLFHTLQELVNLNSIYIFGINEFEELFKKTLRNHENISEDKLLQNVYQYMSRALFPLDKVIFRRFLQNQLPKLRNLSEDESNVSLRSFLKEYLPSGKGKANQQRIILIITSPGTDPSGEIRDAVGESNQYPSPIYYSMGSNVIDNVDKLLSHECDNLICLSNLHIVIDWLPQLSRLLTQAVQQSPTMFAILVTQVNDHLPTSLLEICVKYVYLSSPGLRSLISGLNTDGNLSEAENSRLAYFHGVCCERRNYIPIGWTKPYDFGFNDYRTSLGLIEKVKSRRDRRIQLQYIRGILGSIVYGSKLDTKMDGEMLSALIRKWFSSSDQVNERMLDELSEFAILGMSPNVDRWKVSMFEEQVEKGLKLLEKTSTIASEEKHETEKIQWMVSQIERVTSNGLNLHQARLNNNTNNRGDSIELFMASEMNSARNLLSSLSSDLKDRQLKSFECMARGETPETWLNGWPSGPNESDRFVQSLIVITKELSRLTGRSSGINQFNLGFFLHHSSLINAIKQKASRELGVSIDCVKVLCSWPGQRITWADSVKVTLTGLLLEGAVFDGNVLRDCSVNSDLQTTLPPMTMHFVPEESSASYDNEYVSLPVYGSKLRENLVAWFEIPCKANSQDDWITRGTAILINHPS